MDVVDPGVIVRVATDAVMLVRVRRMVLRESLHLLSVADLAEAVVILLHPLRTVERLNPAVVEYDCHSTAASSGLRHRKAS